MKPSKIVMEQRHKLFCDAYKILQDGAKAAIEAGFAAKSAKVTACKLLKKPHIKAYLAAANNKQSNKVLSKLEVERDELIDKLHKLITMAIDAIEIKAAVSAIAELNKMRGNYAPVKSENTNYDGDKDLQKAKQVSDEAQIKLNKQHKRDY